MLVKVRAAGKDRDEMKRLADIFRGRILDVTDKSYTIELTGTRREARRVSAVRSSPASFWKRCAPERRASGAAKEFCEFERGNRGAVT